MGRGVVGQASTLFANIDFAYGNIYEPEVDPMDSLNTYEIVLEDAPTYLDRLTKEKK
jgi:hypothetical protein